MNMILDNKLNNKETIILDGAIGSEIARLGAAMNSSAWCGVANTVSYTHLTLPTKA